MHPDLEALLALQEKDKTVLGIQEELAALEPELRRLDEALRQAEEEVAAAHRRVAEADNRRAELEGKIEGYRVMQERRRQRLEWVKGAKEASTLMAELDLARSVIAKEEAEWIRSSDKAQDARHIAAEAEKTLDELRVAQAPEREAIAAKQADAEERLAAAEAARERTAATVPAELRERYERIRRGRARHALYPLQNGACGHCFTAIPLNRRHKMLGGAGVEFCEACGVLVYDPGQ